MNFAHPLWLIAALAGAAALLWSYRSLERRRALLLGRFAATRLVVQLTRSVSRRRIWIKRLALIGGCACVCVALAQPQGAYTTEVTHRSGLDIMVAIDTSRSMLTPDVKPNRLTRAKLAAEDLLDTLHGDGVGLIAFAGDAFVEAPITTDYEAYRDAVETLDTNTIPRGGTDIASAIRVAQDSFKGTAASDKILILMTDGEDLGAQGIEAAKEAAKQGLHIFTVGVGTTAGALIPVPDGNGGTDYLKDESGQPVTSHLDVATLQQIAQATGGIYVPLGSEGQGLATIYSRSLAGFARHDLAEQHYRVYRQWFQAPLLAGILLLMFEAVVTTRRTAQRVAPNAAPMARQPAKRLRLAAAPLAMTAATLAFTMLSGNAHASVSDAEKSYRHGDYARADTEYEASARRRPTEAKLQFNVGAAAYKTGDFKTATASFQNAIKTGAPQVQQGAYYNLGNTEYRLGQQTQQAQPAATIEQWQAAVKSYDAALQLQPTDADAKFNRDLVQRKLAQLQQQQQQQQQKQSQSQSQNQNQKQTSQQNSGGQSAQHSAGKNGAQGGGSGTGQQQNSAQGQNQNASHSQSNGHDSAKNQSSGAGKSRQESQNQPAGQGTTPTPSAPHPGGTAAQPSNAQASAAPPAAAGQGASAGTPQAAGPQTSQAAAQNAAPGELTQEQAKQLLDSLKDEEHRLPSAALGLNAASNADNPPLKDW